MVTETYLRDVVRRWGEVFVVLESDREYEIHGEEGYEMENGVVRVKGMHEGEYLVAEFSIDVIEHVYTHKEV